MTWLLNFAFARSKLFAGVSIFALIFLLWGVYECRSRSEFSRQLKQNLLQNEALANEGRKRARAWEEVQRAERAEAEPVAEKDLGISDPPDDLPIANKELEKKMIREKLLKKFRGGLQ